ncbi:MAG: alpha/beta hydrolase [Actinomycetota bacterium]
MKTITAADGTSIAWDEDGAGEPVLLVHGLTESRDNWAPIVERLSTTHRVIALDLRGHGASSDAADYGLEAMAGDVVAVAIEAGAERPHLVGHSLGGTVVAAVGAVAPVASVTIVDQSLRLGAFKQQVMGFESELRDPATFPAVIDAMFQMMAGPLLGTAEFDEITATRRAEQAVVLGVWDLLFTLSEAELTDVVEAAMSGYGADGAPVLSLFGADPGPGYGDWLAARVPGAITELWPDQGHYPHLVDPDRFVTRLRTFWA